jgi:probable phosphoglycerate mutase
MSDDFPEVYLARHGETAWSLTGRHTGMADLPLTPSGEENARRLGRRLASIKFDHVFTSPLQRAARTCELAGFEERAKTDADLVEWNYGQYEGRTTADIRRDRPEWKLFRDGCPGGETLAEVGARADRVIARVQKPGGKTVLFSSGHFLRILGARWCGLEAAAGACFHLTTASLSMLSYEHDLTEPVIKLWNDSNHIRSF